MRLGFLLLLAACTATARSSSPSSSSFHCEVPEDTFEFLHQVNESAVLREKQISEEAKQTGPHLRLGLVTVLHPADAEHSAYGLALNDAYAARHGYTFRVEGGINASVSTSRSLASNNPFRNWMAVNALSHALKTWAVDYDYVVYISTDTAVLKHDLRLEKIAVKYKKNNVVLVGASESMISTDFILVRNNVWTIDFLDDWIRFYKNNNKGGLKDNDLFEKFYKSDEAEMKDNIAIIPDGMLLSEHPPIQRFKKANSLLSMFNQAREMKNSLFKYAHVQLCNAVEEAEGGDVKLPQQLGITKNVIIDISQKVYQELWEQQMDAYMLKSDKGENDFRVTEELSFVASHLVMALTYDKSPAAKESLLNIRSKTFKHMYLNMKRNENKEATEDLIYTLKSVLRFGQDYVVHVKDKKEKKVAMKVIKELLEELMIHRPDDHDTQEALVNMNCDIGQMYVDEGRYEDALPEFLSALRIARRLGNFIGERVILAPANHAADTLLLLKRYEEATVMYQAAVHLIRKFFGKTDLTTGYALVQSSIANYYFKKYKTCFKQVEEAIGIMDEEGQEEVDPEMYKHAVKMRGECAGKKDEPHGDDSKSKHDEF